MRNWYLPRVAARLTFVLALFAIFSVAQAEEVDIVVELPDGTETVLGTFDNVTGLVTVDGQSLSAADSATFLSSLGINPATSNAANPPKVSVDQAALAAVSVPAATGTVQNALQNVSSDPAVQQSVANSFSTAQAAADSGSGNTGGTNTGSVNGGTSGGGGGGGSVSDETTK